MAEERQPDIAAGRLSPEDYAANFSDLHPPLDRHQAIVEADRCYFCYDAPCIKACPTGIDIPIFIREILTGNPKGAAETILVREHPRRHVRPRLPDRDAVRGGLRARDGRGQAGPHRRAAALRHRRLHGRGGDQPFARAAPTGKRVAVVGAGPAGLSCAHRLAMHGHDVVIYDARPKPGGLNEYGIAAYKAPGDFAAGARSISSCRSAASPSRPARRSAATSRSPNFAATTTPCSSPSASPASTRSASPDEDVAGVEDAVDYIAELRQASDLATLPVGRRVVVIGGGMTAIDIASQSKRLGAEDVTIVYRRGPEQHGRQPTTSRSWRRPTASRSSSTPCRSGWSPSGGQRHRRRVRIHRRARRQARRHRRDLHARRRRGLQGDRPDLRAAALERRRDSIELEGGRIKVDARAPHVASPASGPAATASPAART